MTQSFSIQGFDKIKKELSTLEPKVRNNEMKKGVRAGAAFIRKEARKNIPSNLQTLKKSISVKARRGGPKDIKFTITPTKGKNAKYNAWYAHFFEFGVRPHEIEPKEREFLGNLTNNKNFGKSVQHPGIAPLHFMMRSLLGNEQKVIDEIGKKVKAGLAKRSKR